MAMNLAKRFLTVGWLAIIFLSQEAFAQNLVVNPSFEQYTNCRDSTATHDITASTFNIFTNPNGFPPGTGAPGWFAATRTGCTHFLPCNYFPSIRFWGRRYTGWYRPRTGGAYILLSTYGNEQMVVIGDSRYTYAQGQLTQPLQTGCTYRISCWARLARTGEHPQLPTASDNLSAYFTSSRFGTSTTAALLTIQPQAFLLPAGQFITDTLNYTYISSTFVAQGGEQYFTLGNFRPKLATSIRVSRPYNNNNPLALYAIDDVSVEAVPPPGLALSIGPDLWLGACPGATPATLTAPPGFQGYRWSTGQTTASITVNQPGRYGLTADFGCGQLRDSVEVRRYDPLRTRLLAPLPALCPGQTLLLTAAPGFRAYQWADGPTGPVSQPGRYRLLARTADGCSVRDSLDVALLPAPAIPAGFPPDTLVCAQEAWRYTPPPAPPGSTYAWSTDSPDATLYVPPGAAGAYTPRCAPAARP